MGEKIMQYQDQYSRYHNKPVTDLKPVPTNNSWLYTSYAQKVGLSFDSVKLKHCFSLCLIKLQTRYEILRSPGKSLPPISRDEILGLSDLKLLKPEHLQGWNFSPYKLPKFNLIKLLKQLYEAKGKDRNYFWENNLDQLYRFAFSVPFSDRHFLLKNWNKFRVYNPVHLFYAAFGKLQSKIKPNGLDWLKYDEKLGLKDVKVTFPEDHPVRTALGV